MNNDINFKSRLALFVIAAVAVLIGFRAMILQHLPGMFMAAEEDLSYGWYVPIFSLYVLWTDREKIRKSLGRPSLGAALALVPCVALAILGARGMQVRFELLAFVGLCILLPWTFFGRETAKAVLFPSLFLLFCMPVMSILVTATVPLRLLVSASASGLLSAFGMVIERSGNIIQLPEVLVNGVPFAIGVADPCSGMRSIFALLAIAAGYGYFTQPTWFRRGILFVLAVPLAILGNIIRILTICVVARCVNPAFATGHYHDWVGYGVFLLALAMLVAIAGLMTRCWPKPAAKEPAESAAEAAQRPLGVTARVAPLFAILLLVPVFSYLAVSPESELAPAPAVGLPERVVIWLPHQLELPLLQSGARYLPNGPEDPHPPRAVLHAREVFDGIVLEPSLAETNLLIGAAIDKRYYRPRLGPTPFLPKAGPAAPIEVAPLFQVTRIISNESKSSLHRPEICLRAQGLEQGVQRALMVDGVEWQLIQVFDRSSNTESLYAYTFVNQAGFRTSSHARRVWRDILDRSLYNRIDRWVMTSVLIPKVDDDTLRSVLAVLKEEL